MAQMGVPSVLPDNVVSTNTLNVDYDSRTEDSTFPFAQEYENLNFIENSTTPNPSYWPNIKGISADDWGNPGTKISQRHLQWRFFWRIFYLVGDDVEDGGLKINTAAGVFPAKNMAYKKNVQPIIIFGYTFVPTIVTVGGPPIPCDKDGNRFPRDDIQFKFGMRILNIMELPILSQYFNGVEIKNCSVKLNLKQANLFNPNKGDNTRPLIPMDIKVFRHIPQNMGISMAPEYTAGFIDSSHYTSRHYDDGWWIRNTLLRKGPIEKRFVVANDGNLTIDIEPVRFKKVGMKTVTEPAYVSYAEGLKLRLGDYDNYLNPVPAAVCAAGRIPYLECVTGLNAPFRDYRVKSREALNGFTGLGLFAPEGMDRVIINSSRIKGELDLFSLQYQNENGNNQEVRINPFVFRSAIEYDDVAFRAPCRINLDSSTSIDSGWNWERFDTWFWSPDIIEFRQIDPEVFTNISIEWLAVLHGQPKTKAVIFTALDTR